MSARPWKKLERWEVGLWDRTKLEKALKVLKRLKGLVPPRVTAAVVRTWRNGWCARRRFQLKHDNRCIFGCEEEEDSVEHYSCCKQVECWAGMELWCEAYDSAIVRRRSFLLLGSELISDDSLIIGALRIAAVYRVHNSVRHSGCRSAQRARNALSQAIKEVAMGSNRCARLVARRG